MPSQFIALSLSVALLAFTSTAARAEEDPLPPQATLAVADEEALSRCDIALALWDDVAADPDPAISPTTKARRHLKRGVALCRAGDDEGADYLFNALTLVGAAGT